MLSKTMIFDNCGLYIPLFFNFTSSEAQMRDIIAIFLPKLMRDKLVRPKMYDLRHKEFPFVKELLLVYLRNYVCYKQIGLGKVILQHQNINHCQITEFLVFVRKL